MKIDVIDAWCCSKRHEDYKRGPSVIPKNLNFELQPKVKFREKKYLQGDYLGGFLDGLKHGYGVFKSNDGKIYQGNWDQDQKSGFGIFKWPDGSKMECSYLNGMRHGHGVFTYCDGETHEGEWLFNNKVGIFKRVASCGS